MRYDYKCACDHEFVVSHGMFEKPVIKCPKCNSSKTEKIFKDVPEFYVRGNGYLDKKGVKRDMNLHKLVNDDPYANMREPGEAYDLAQNIRKAGKFSPKRKYFTPKTTKKNK